MPNYIYRCVECKKRFEKFLSYNEYGAKEVQCPSCRSTSVQRVITRVRIGRSDDSRLQNMADPANLEGIDDDPQALGRVMRQMSSELGEDMGPEFNEVVNRLEKGQSPEDIEKDLPDLGDADGGIDD